MAANGRRAAVAGWLLEVSALVAVFPPLEAFLKGNVDKWLVGGSLFFACAAFATGLVLTKDGP